MYPETSVNKHHAPWCVDGRPDFDRSKGPQMLGGSINPILLKSLFDNTSFGEADILLYANLLIKNGFKIGVHRGQNKNLKENKSDCGFADNLVTIIKTAKDNKTAITKNLSEIFEKYQGLLNISKVKFMSNVELTFEKIVDFDLENIKIVGENLISLLEKLGEPALELEGSHQEVAAFIDFEDERTLDTNRINSKHRQYFNLDIWEVVDQTEVLKINKDFAIFASLILYLATEIVLVEEKGKQALPVYVHTKDN